MMILRFMEQEVPCAYATKGTDWVKAHDEQGNTVFEANGVKDMSMFTLEGGDWTEPEPSTEEILLEMAADHEERLCMMELGI